MTFWDVVFLLGLGILTAGLWLYDLRYAMIFSGATFMIVGMRLSHAEGKKQKPKAS